MSIASIPSIFYEFSFNADPNQNTLPPYWTDLSARVQYGWRLDHGRQYELDGEETGTWKVELANSDGALDPNNASSPYWPNVLPYRQCRIRVVLGNNLLSPDQASAGEYAGLGAGPLPAWLRVAPGVGNTMVIASVGASAYQGTRVFSTTVPSGAASPSDLLQVSVQQVTGGRSYTFSAQLQATTAGQNPNVQLIVNWLASDGSTISFSNGLSQSLTGASGIWTQATVSDTAPTAAVAALLCVSTFTSPTANSTIWVDGLQLEARGFATQWQMPWTPGTNLLPQNVATGSETISTLTDQVSSWFYATAGTTLTRAIGLTAAPPGLTTAAAWAIPAGTYGALPGLYTGSSVQDPTALGPVADCVQVTAGAQYTGSVYVTRTGPDATVNVNASVVWFDSSGNLLSGTATGANTAVPTSGWGRVTVTGTAPTGAVWGRMSIHLATATLTGTETIYATGWQMEQAGAATTWADPGPATFLFTGMVERWPETWVDLDGTWGTSKLECVDARAALAQFPLISPYVNELLALGPNFLYTLADPVGATSCADAAGRRPPAPVENSPYGVGTATFGAAITATTSSLGFVGASGTVLTLANNASNVSPRQFAETYVSLHKTTVPPGPPVVGPWSRIICFRVPTAPTAGNSYMLWYAAPSSYYSNPSLFQIHIESDGKLYVLFTDNTGSAGVNYISTGSVCDGNWHMVVVGAANPLGSSGANTVWLDGTQVATASGVTAGTSFATDVIGALVLFGNASYSNGFNGDLALVAELPIFLTGTQVATLYNSWRTASAGDSSTARYTRILNWIGYTGKTSIGTGSTASMGPATDVTGRTALEALDAVATTENGGSYVSAAGALTFTGRAALYGVRTPAVVFGEGRPAGNTGEWPAEIGSIDFDPAHIANNVQITQFQGPTYTAQDTASQRRYFPRRFQRTINTSSGSEAQDAANYLLSQLKDPKRRGQAIRLHPAAVVGLLPVLAQLDKNTRIRYIKRPTGSPAITLDGFLQRISWEWSPDSDVYVGYQVSSADLTNYWRLGALHTTLSTQAASGQATVTINALPDAATNKLAQSLPGGYSLTFEPGTPRAETIAIAPGGIPTTSLGYSTATLTMASNFAFTHPALSVVCESLPTGYTDPATWDASSVLGASYAPILSGGGLGMNTVTVGPLSDSARNALGSNWNTGDTIWLSSGTANFEAATIQSVATTYPGYTSCQITLTANLTHNHNASEYVSDPLPSNTINPATWTAPTTRVTY